MSAAAWNMAIAYLESSLPNTHTHNRRFTRALFRKFRYIPEKHYSMRNIRLDILSLEARRKLADEIILFKIHTGKISTHLHNSLHFNQQIRNTRHSTIFYLPFVTTNVEYFSPMLRIQRNHDNLFSRLDLNENCLVTFKRYAIHEIKSTQTSFDYSFE